MSNRSRRSRLQNLFLPWIRKLPGAQQFVSNENRSMQMILH